MDGLEIVAGGHNRWQAVRDGTGWAMLKWSGEHMSVYLAGGREIGTLYRSDGRMTVRCAGCGQPIGARGDGTALYNGPDGMVTCTGERGSVNAVHLPGERVITYTWRAYLPGGSEAARRVTQAEAVGALISAV